MIHTYEYQMEEMDVKTDHKFYNKFYEGHERENSEQK